MAAQPFLDWLHRVDPTSAELKLEDLRREPTIYLLPVRYRGRARGYVRESQRDEEQLDGWYRVPTAWPVDRTFDTFIRSFECSFDFVLIDLCYAPLMREETGNQPRPSAVSGLVPGQLLEQYALCFIQHHSAAGLLDTGYPAAISWTRFPVPKLST